MEKRGVSLFAVVLATLSAATTVHLPVSTTVPLAQTAIDRGLYLYYAYNGGAAARTFAEAAQLDQRLAMAYWGMALANGPDLNTPQTEERFDLAAQAIRKATSLGAGAAVTDRRFIAIMALRYQGKFAAWAANDAAYRAAMDAFAQSSHDENARLLAAEALLEHGGLTWQQGVLASAESREAIALVSDVLRDDPANPMANHLCIHLYDLAEDRTPALPCAQRLDAATFPPQAEHLAHMPAHYWIETGNYAAALASSERAVTLMNALSNDDAGPKHVQSYAKHDVAVGYSAAMMLGDYGAAQRWAGRMTSAFGTDFDAITALRFGRYESAYAADDNAFSAASVRGLAALQLGHLSEGRKLAAGISPAGFTRGYLPQLLEARLAETDGQYAQAENWIARSLANQRAGFSGELIPFFPAEEALGALRLRRGDSAGAIAAFNEALNAYPNDPRALFGLAQALDADGQSTQAAAAHARFEKEWKGADTNVRDALP
ncbi:MAG: tetratricopeptide repeat protein [Candidatus Cybelea sp.]